MLSTRCLLFAGLACGAAFGQTTAVSPQFEVASIRPSSPTPPERLAIGLHIDGAQARFTYLSLKDYIRMAYRVQLYQVESPEWMAGARFDISAKIPDGVDRDKVPEMLQTLLADRFGLKFHRESKDFPVYAMIRGKGDLKVKESPDDTPPASDGTKQQPIDVTASGSRAGTTVNLGPGSYFTFGNDRIEVKKLDMVRFADVLSRFTDRPVVDMTGLKGRYDLEFEVTPDDYRTMMIRAAIAAGVKLPPEAYRLLSEGAGDSLFSAIQGLGLKLDPRKAPLEVLVVDHAETKPTEN
jgi:uncharacterized protein (TIGR03435 family)